MSHNYNTRPKESEVNNEALAKLERNIIAAINGLKEKIINLKDTVIKRLKKENDKLCQKCVKLDSNLISVQSLVHILQQYDKRNNIIVFQISETYLKEI